MRWGGASRPCPRRAGPGRVARDVPRLRRRPGRALTEAGRAFRRVIHETIARVTDDLDRDFHFNTAISAIMELVNALHAFEAASGAPGTAGARARSAPPSCGRPWRRCSCSWGPSVLT